MTIERIVLEFGGRSDDDTGMATIITHLPQITNLFTVYAPFAIAYIGGTR